VNWVRTALGVAVWAPMALVVMTAAAFAVGGEMQGASATGAAPVKGQMLPVMDRPVETLIIGIDLSRSNPVIKDKAFAAKVAQRIQPMIEGLGPKSKIILRTFGSYDVASNQLKLDQNIAAKRNLAPDVAKLVSGIIAGVPTLIEKKKLTAQNETNIVAFLDNMAKVAQCGKTATRVILATDGIEDSELANLNRKGKDGLPVLPAPKAKPDGAAPYKDCTEFMILGLGQGTDSPQKTQFLTDEWSRYATAAGFKKVTLLNDW
jgi:hypothetical protein